MCPSHPTANDRTDDSATTRLLRRRRVMALGAGVGATLLAGCSTGTDLSDPDADGPASSATDGPTAAAGTFRLLISDRPAAIGDFDSLDVTFDRARVFRAGGDDGDGEAETDTQTAAAEDASGTATESPTASPTESPTDTATESPTATATESPTATSNASEQEEPPDEDDEKAEDDGNGKEDGNEEDESDGGDQRGFSVMDLGGATVDLTQVVGEKAMGVFEGELEEGRYAKIELYAAGVDGVVDGESVDVTIPSGKLQIVKPFEVYAGETLSFVFDINVVEKGQTGEYNLLPVISESGVAGEDVGVEEVGNAAAGGGPDGTDEPDADGEDGAGTDEPGDGDERGDDESGDGGPPDDEEGGS